MSKVALLDGDSWVYRCGFAAEKTRYLLVTPEFNKEFDTYREASNALAESPNSMIWNRKIIEPLENCLQMVKSSLENTLNAVGTETYKLYISGRGNFRDDIFPDYKSNRETLGKPKYYRDIRNYLVANWHAEVVDGMEADDAIGIAAVASPKSVIVAVDKDLDQIPGSHYNWTTGESYTVGPREGMRFFYEQLLSGDPTDNVPGITGIGKVKAAKALESCATPKACAEVVLGIYTGNGLTLGELERNASLLWIRRAENQKHPFWKHLEMAT